MSVQMSRTHPYTLRAPTLPCHRCGGFTMIEVLVTVVILAVGLLGLAGLQTLSMRNNHSAYLRSQAVQLAYDMADRVRANTEFGSNFDGITAAQNTNCESTSGCSASAMAANDVFQWTQAIATILPAGDGIICLDSTPNDGTANDDAACDSSGTSYAVKIWWNDNRLDDGTPPQRFVMSFRP